jgi:hypothetical protein
MPSQAAAVEAETQREEQAMQIEPVSPVQAPTQVQPLEQPLQVTEEAMVGVEPAPPQEEVCFSLSLYHFRIDLWQAAQIEMETSQTEVISLETD